MSFPVLTVGPAEPPEELAPSLAGHGARDVLEFRRASVEAAALGKDDAAALFRKLEDATAAGYEPAAAESRALARETGASPGEIIAYSGYSDFADLVRQDHEAELGCTVVALREPSAGPGLLLAQTWDYHKFFEDQSLIVKRDPRTGYRSAALTTVLGHAYLGVNEAGVAVFINNLKGNSAQVGLPFSAAVQKLLAEAGSAKEALSVLSTTDLMSTHNYVVGGPEAAYNVEAGADQAEVTPLDREHTPWVHTNHTLHEELDDVVVDYSETSQERFQRTWGKLHGEDGGGDDGLPVDIPALFTDHEAPLCRHGDAPLDVATIGAVWVTRDPVTLHAVDGPPCSNDGQAVRVGGG